MNRSQYFTKINSQTTSIPVWT